MSPHDKPRRSNRESVEAFVAETRMRNGETQGYEDSLLAMLQAAASSLDAAIQDRDSRAREACTYEKRTGCSFAPSAIAPISRERIEQLAEGARDPQGHPGWSPTNGEVLALCRFALSATQASSESATNTEGTKE